MKYNKIAILSGGINIKIDSRYRNIGNYIYDHLKPKFDNVTHYTDFDINNNHLLHTITQENDLIINCVEYNGISSSEKDMRCFSYNTTYVERLSRFCKLHSCGLIHISSEHVYSLNINTSINELGEKSPPTKYGQSKLYGEIWITNQLQTNYLILRPSWLYFPVCNFTYPLYNCIVDEYTKNIHVDNKYIGRPTSINTINTVVESFILNKLPSGIYNVSDDGQPCTKYDIVQFLYKIYKNHDINIVPLFYEENKLDDTIGYNLDCSKLYDIINKQSKVITTWQTNMCNEINNK